MVPERDRVCKSCAPIVGFAAELNKAVLQPKAHAATYLVFETEARCPSITPVVEREAIRLC